MSETFQLIRGIRYGGVELTKIESITDDLVTLLDVSVAASAVGEEHNLPLDVSLLQALVIISDTDGEFRINDDANGAVVPLKADLPCLWSVASGLDNPLGEENIVSIFVDNDSTTGAMALKFKALSASEPD